MMIKFDRKKNMEDKIVKKKDLKNNWDNRTESKREKSMKTNFYKSNIER